MTSEIVRKISTELIPDSEVDFAGDLTRGHVLQYLLVKNGGMTEGQLMQLSDEFRNDAATGNLRTLNEVYKAAFSHTNKENRPKPVGNRFIKDDVLYHTILAYREDEFQDDWNEWSLISNPSETTTHTDHEILSKGNPVLADIYSQLRIGLIQFDNYSLQFKPTNKARLLAPAVNGRFQIPGMRGTTRIFVGEDSENTRAMRVV